MAHRRPRVLFVSHQASLTGAPMMLLHLLRWMRENTDVDFEILLLRRGPLEAEFASLGRTHVLPRAPIGSFLEKLERGLYFIGVGPIAGRMRGLRYRYRLWRLGQFDLVYLNAALSFTLVRYFPRRSRHAVIGHLHELESGINASLPASRPLSSLVWQFDRLIVCSDAVADHVLKEHDVPPDRLRQHYEFITLPTPVSDEEIARVRAELMIPEGAAVVGNVGTVEWRKGTDLFVQLAAHVAALRPDRPTVFVWVGAYGDEHDFPHIEQELRHADLVGSTRFVRPVRDVRPYYALFDMLALTSREDPFPLVCLEASAFETPVLAFDRSGGIPELLLPDRGILVPYLAVAAMANAVSELLDNPDRRRAMGQRASAAVHEHYTVDVIAPRIFAEIEELLAAKSYSSPTMTRPLTLTVLTASRRTLARVTRPLRVRWRRRSHGSKPNKVDARSRTRLAWQAGGGRHPIFDPPDTPEGWIIGPPDFVGVGTARCGTSWWCENLFAHPGVSRARGALKECQYFPRFRDAQFGDADIAAYYRFFPRVAGTLAGEWSPHYMFDESGLRHLRRSAPDAKIFVLVRDPVERYWSNIHFNMWWSEFAGVSTSPDGWLQRGIFTRGLENVARVFDPEQVLVLQYERCLAETSAQLRRTYEFVGLEPGFVPPMVEKRVAQGSGQPKPPMSPETRETMTEFYRPHVERLRDRWPEIDVSLWPNFRDLA